MKSGTLCDSYLVGLQKSQKAFGSMPYCFGVKCERSVGGILNLVALYHGKIV